MEENFRNLKRGGDDVLIGYIVDYCSKKLAVLNVDLS